MKKINTDELVSLLKEDRDMAERLSEYLKGETDETAVGEKTMEFMRKEGYEISTEGAEALSADELENVSGGKIDVEYNANKVGRAIGWVLRQVVTLT